MKFYSVIGMADRPKSPHTLKLVYIQTPINKNICQEILFLLFHNKSFVFLLSLNNEGLFEVNNRVYFDKPNASDLAI